ncbi:HAD family hydrolase [Micromonospora sp. NPDC049559]|uniref:HAD family hydrolase n=1 Tax=Micromonospora sp. NPDC049559 TaxID=3155923 RepID=UPI00343F2A96
MPAYRAVLFDFFGTLTRSVQRGSGHGAVADALGCDPEALVEVLDSSFYLRASGALGDAVATLRWACERAGGHASEAALRAAAVARREAVRADTRLRAEAEDALRALRRRGVRTGVVSDCTHELPAFLPQLPVAPLLDVLVFSVQVGRCKPDPAIYLTACERLGVPPRRCLYVGDGGSQELSGATRAGLTAVRLAAPDLAGHLVFNAETHWRGPTLTSLAEVVDLVDGIAPAAGVPSATAPAAAVVPAGIAAGCRGD